MRIPSGRRREPQIFFGPEREHVDLDVARPIDEYTIRVPSGDQAGNESLQAAACSGAGESPSQNTPSGVLPTPRRHDTRRRDRRW